MAELDLSDVYSPGVLELARLLIPKVVIYDPETDVISPVDSVRCRRRVIAG